VADTSFVGAAFAAGFEHNSFAGEAADRFAAAVAAGHIGSVDVDHTAAVVVAVESVDTEPVARRLAAECRADTAFAAAIETTALGLLVSSPASH